MAVRQMPQDAPAAPDRLSVRASCPATALTAAMDEFRTPSG